MKIPAAECEKRLEKIMREDIPENTILDDLFVPMNAVFQGYRVVFDEKAIILGLFLAPVLQWAIDHSSSSSDKPVIR